MNAARDTAFDWLFWRCFVLICVLCVLSVAQHQQQQQQKTFTTQIAYTHNGWSREKERKKKINSTEMGETLPLCDLPSYILYKTGISHFLNDFSWMCQVFIATTSDSIHH